MKIGLKNIPSGIDSKNVFKKTSGFANRHESFVVFLIFSVLFAYVGFLWYRYAYDYRWSEAKKQEYVSSKNELNDFNKVKFDKVLRDINFRQEDYQKNIEVVKDIFRLKQ
ncbi:MAG: hypothetical protein Q8L11_03555 [Candidatus Moranbacteria bacterium]|nr:hypothetical protein [Candidatus Moranbacteria bacterium]